MSVLSEHLKHNAGNKDGMIAGLRGDLNASPNGFPFFE
jgi:hypothetical protein